MMHGGCVGGYVGVVDAFLHHSSPCIRDAGTADTTIPLAWGRATGSSLSLKDIDVQFKEYPEAMHEFLEDQVRI